MPSWCLQTQPLFFHNQWDTDGMQMTIVEPYYRRWHVLQAFLCNQKKNNSCFPPHFAHRQPQTTT